MPRWPSSLERKRQARLNIIKHRQDLLKHLEEINDTVLKPRIKLEPKDIKLYELEVNNKKTILSEIKEEEDQNINRVDDNDDEDDEYDEFKDPSECSDDDISIGSHEFWNGYQTSEDSFADSRRRSKRLKADKNDGQKKITRNKQNDFEYDLDSVLNNITDDLDHSKRYTVTTPKASPNPPKESTKRFREHEQRINHNAKERACRERIAMMFLDLRQYCSYLNTNKRNPSKHSILLAAKKECDLLRSYEKKLSNEKLKLAEKKKQLEVKLQTLTRRSNRV